MKAAPFFLKEKKVINVTFSISITFSSGHIVPLVDTAKHEGLLWKMIISTASKVLVWSEKYPKLYFLKTVLSASQLLIKIKYLSKIRSVLAFKLTKNLTLFVWLICKFCVYWNVNT